VTLKLIIQLTNQPTNNGEHRVNWRTLAIHFALLYAALGFTYSVNTT